jgi:hypothetical protein
LLRRLLSPTAAGRLQDPPERPPIEVPDVAVPGQVIEIRVNTGVKHVFIKIPGQVGVKRLTLDEQGRVEWRVPPDLRPPKTIIVADMNFPNPEAEPVTIVSGD